MKRFRLKPGHWAAIASLAVGLLAVAPGSWGSALAQTAGVGGDGSTPVATSTAPATATTTGTPVGTATGTATAASTSTATATAATTATAAATPAPTPAPATVTVTVVVNNQTQTIVTTPGNLAAVTIPPGAQISSITLDVITSPSAAAATGDIRTVLDYMAESNITTPLRIVGYIFEIDFTPLSAASRSQALVADFGTLAQFGTASFQAAPVALAKPATATLKVLPETLAAVGGDLSRLSVVWVDPVAKVSEPVKMLPSPAPGVLAFEFTKKGAYAVLVSEVAPAAVTAPRPANTGTGIDDARSVALPVVGALLALGAVGALGGRAMRTRKA